MKNKADKLKRIGVIGNSQKKSCATTVAQAARIIRKSGRKLFSDVSTDKLARLKAEVCPDMLTLARSVDLLLVFGGDGTMLRVAREIAGASTPVLGINIGGLGFLTAVSSDDLDRALTSVLQGEFTFERRALIEATARRGKKTIRKNALNDIVVSRGEVSRLIELAVAVDGEPLTRYRCDGLIVSSPTGSTAYSLAAGGAVVSPVADVFAITPISPHTLSNRSLILPLDSTIRIEPISSTSATILSADGELMGELSPGDVVTVRRSRHSVRFMHPAGSSFFEALRRKLHWRGTYL